MRYRILLIVLDGLAARVGARLGNWNDRHFAGDTGSLSPWCWHAIDRLAHVLYVRGD